VTKEQPLTTSQDFFIPDANTPGASKPDFLSDAGTLTADIEL
jgi:hypothetical protein